MDFCEATDNLCGKVDHSDVARTLGVSLQTIRQARLNPETRSHRPPPIGWREVVVRLAEERAGHYRRLIDELRTSGSDQP